MNKYSYTLSLLLCCFLFSTTSQAQSFLNKTLKVLDAVNEISKANNTSKKQNNDTQDNTQINTTTQNGIRITVPFQGLMFKIKSCTASESTITLDLSIKNQEKNQRFMFGGTDQRVATVAVDDLDNSYDSEKIKISINDQYAEVCKSDLFPTNVPVKMRIFINEVDPTARMITMLTLRIEGFNAPVTFYNIPIERPAAIVSVSGIANSASQTTKQDDTEETSKLKKVIGKWRLVSLKKNGKEIPFKPSELHFQDTEDDPYLKDMTETIAGKTRECGYAVMPDYDNILIMSLSITDDETDNEYTIQTVDDNKLVLTFGFYGESSIKGELAFNKI